MLAEDATANFEEPGSRKVILEIVRDDEVAAEIIEAAIVDVEIVFEGIPTVWITASRAFAFA
jgi:hypothetical protein